VFRLAVTARGIESELNHKDMKLCKIIVIIIIII